MERSKTEKTRELAVVVTSAVTKTRELFVRAETALLLVVPRVAALALSSLLGVSSEHQLSKQCFK